MKSNYIARQREQELLEARLEGIRLAHKVDLYNLMVYDKYGAKRLQRATYEFEETLSEIVKDKDAGLELDYVLEKELGKDFLKAIGKEKFEIK